MGETRVDLLHLLEDLRDAYPGSIEETIVTEIVANALDSGATRIVVRTDPAASTLTVVDDGIGMQKAQLARYHDVAASTKTRGKGIGFAGVGIKLGLLICDEVFTETRQTSRSVATTWRLSSKRRAPWKWTEPVGLVAAHGTAVRLKVQHGLSPLVDSDFIRRVLAGQFLPLFDPTFDSILSTQYAHAVRFEVNDDELTRTVIPGDTAAIAVRLPRKRKPSASGYMIRAPSLPEHQQGMAVSTFGKVIKRGWDWLGITPADPTTIGGVIEAPALSECLTLNKADFIRSGSHGATYLAYRKAIQEAVSNQFAEWGASRDQRERDQRRAARPVERDLEKVLIDLADEFPLLATLVERRTGGQRRLPIGIANEDATHRLPVGGPEAAPDDAPDRTRADTEPPTSTPEQIREPEPPAITAPRPATKGPTRPTKYRLNIRFQERPSDPELARLIESTVWINESHPAYRRSITTRAAPYHIALSTAMALSRLAVEPAQEHDFITAFLACWGTEKKLRR